MFNKDDIQDFGLDEPGSWINYCYAEDGSGVTCDWCDSDLIWYEGQYICRGCGKVFERAEFFNYIGADPPDVKCLTCEESYPICKKWCDQVQIDPSDEFYW